MERRIRELDPRRELRSLVLDIEFGMSRGRKEAALRHLMDRRKKGEDQEDDDHTGHAAPVYTVVVNERGHTARRAHPGRFRCLVCQRYVTGTATGHCPSCGFVPPSAATVAETGKSRLRPWLLVLVLVGLLALAVAR